jgi:hypothetical protein
MGSSLSARFDSHVDVDTSGCRNPSLASCRSAPRWEDIGDTCGGKAVLITGGGTGIEQPPRPRSLACGSTVAVSGRTAHAAEAAQMLGELGADRSARVADVTAPRTSDFPSKGPAQSGDGSWKFDDLIFRAPVI